MRCSECGEKGHLSKTCIVRYKCLEKINSRKKCAICLEQSFKSQCKTRCGHLFHINCIKEWFKHNATCPICRTVIVEKTAKDIVDMIIESILDLEFNSLDENTISLYFENEILT